jgi:hypothetical protein
VTPTEEPKSGTDQEDNTTMTRKELAELVDWHQGHERKLKALNAELLAGMRRDVRLLKGIAQAASDDCTYEPSEIWKGIERTEALLARAEKEAKP